MTNAQIRHVRAHIHANTHAYIHAHAHNVRTSTSDYVSGDDDRALVMALVHIQGALSLDLFEAKS